MALKIQQKFVNAITRKLTWLPKKAVMPLAAVLVVGVAVTAFAFSYGPLVNVQPENGSLSGGAVSVTDAGASGGESVKFQTPGACPNAPHTPGGDDGMGGCWPYAGNTGVPAGTTLTTYSGPCTITVDDTVIDSKTVNCGLTIEAANVTITKSVIIGGINLASDSTGYSFTITDSEVDAGPITPAGANGIGDANFTALRVDVWNGNRSIWCEFNCTVQDSWMHDQDTDEAGVAHESAIRMGDGSNIIHNSILCNAADVPPDGGCSANLTGYGDFAPIRNNLIEKNLFVATTGGTCAYGGSSGDDGSKPYGHLAENIRFIDNIFQRGPGGKCGSFFPITDFDDTRPNNLWQNNRWDDGGVVPPAN